MGKIKISKYKCDKCKREFTSEGYLEYHFCEAVKCNKCNKWFETEMYFKNHQCKGKNKC